MENYTESTVTKSTVVGKMKEQERREWEDLDREIYLLSEDRKWYVDVLSRFEKDLDRRMKDFFPGIQKKHPEIRFPVRIIDRMEHRASIYCDCTHPILFKECLTSKNGDQALILQDDIEDLEGDTGILVLKLDALCSMGINRPSLGIHTHTKVLGRNIYIYYDRFLEFINSEGK
jgi:hypothetical protein